ncbi:hypothetical protein [Bradyrhizobium sp. 76]|nr:hypothetical protein [Bradyrhizobium sp. 76]
MAELEANASGKPVRIRNSVTDEVLATKTSIRIWPPAGACR